jgi:2-polyprenyl-6-methoxyphenol hydroxylase-like FAD-dependent oxidoreductase
LILICYKVRSQLLKNPSAVLSQYVPITGEVSLPREKFEPIRNIGTAGLLAYTPQVLFHIGARWIDANQSMGDYYWVCAFRIQDPIKENLWMKTASKQELYDRSVELTKDLPPHITAIIRETDPKGMLQPPLQFIEYFVPEGVMPEGRVTLLGDAAHTMTPFRGAGANTAIRDACDLAKLLIRAKYHDDRDDIGLLKQYERIFVARGQQMVLQSREGSDGEKLKNLHKR